MDNNLENISTLIFDFGGVIVNLDLPLCISNLKKIGVTGIEHYLSNFGQADFFLQWEKGEIGPEEFRNKIRNISTLNPSDEEINAAWCSFLQDIPESRVKLLVELRKKYRLLLLSNTNPLHIHINAKDEFGKYGYSMQDLFDKCYLSYEMGVTKPNREIFEMLLQDSGLTAEECLFLDDGIKNTEAAHALGFKTYLVTPGEDLGFLTGR